MKLNLENTTQVVDVNGVPARVWEGKTESGTKVIALITRVAVGIDEPSEVHERFKRELQEVKAPSAEVAVWPLSMILGLLSIMILSSCGGNSGQSVVVWNGEDIVGAAILVLTIISGLLLHAIAWLKYKWTEWKRKRKSN